MNENSYTGMKGKHRKGLTLVELIIAVTVLAIAVAGIITINYATATTSLRAHHITIAGIEAQLQMEQLMGRSWDGDLETVLWNDIVPGTGSDLFVRVVFRPHEANDGHGWSNMGIPHLFATRFGDELDASPCSFTNATGDPDPCGADDCPPNALMLMRVTIYVYETDTPEDEDRDFIIMQSNILPVNNRII